MKNACATGLALVIWAGLVAAAAGQNEPQFNFREMFLQLDANGDTVIDRDEVPEAGRAAFQKLLKLGDANHDGRLEVAELRALGEKVRRAGLFGGGAALLERLRKADQNGDGNISRAEFPGPPALFDRLDTDQDGVLSKEEIAKLPGPGAPPALAQLRERLKGMDKDGDGKVTREEFQGPEALFDRLDTNKDGFLSTDDARAAGAPFSKKEDAKTEGAPAASKRAERKANARFGPRLQAMDKDADGKISRQEFQGRPVMFDRLDANHDGFLTPAEAARLAGAGGRLRFRMLDKNADGKLSPDEFPGPKPLFERLDSNGDGFLSADEAARFRPGEGAAKKQP